MLNEHKNNVISIIKWFLLASAVGCVVGVLDAAFLKILDRAISFRNGIPLFYILLPFVLYGVALLGRKVAKRHTDYSTDAVINKINSYRSISFISIFKGFTLSIVTMLIGGSAGKEAPCADVGAGDSSI